MNTKELNALLAMEDFKELGYEFTGNSKDWDRLSKRACLELSKVISVPLDEYFLNEVKGLAYELIDFMNANRINKVSDTDVSTGTVTIGRTTVTKSGQTNSLKTFGNTLIPIDIYRRLGLLGLIGGSLLYK